MGKTAMSESENERLQEAQHYPRNDPAAGANAGTSPSPVDHYWKWKTRKAINPCRHGATAQIKPVRDDDPNS
jgi:hypothetical protein